MNNIVNVLVILVCCTYQISAHCGPERKFSLLAPCKPSCEKEKPPIYCVPEPGCYCEGDKLWDKTNKKCVFRAQCPTKSSKGYGGYSYDSSASASTDTKSSNGFGIFSVVKSIISSPIKIPSAILKNVRSTIEKVILFKLKLIRVPWTVAKTILGSFSGTFKQGFSWIFDTISKISAFNAEFVVGIINKIKGVFGWIVKEFAGFGIDIIQVFKNVYSYGVKNAEGVVSGIFNFLGWSLTKVSDIFNGGLKISHIKDILELPIIKNVVGTIETIKKGEYQAVISQFKDLDKLVGGIVYDHKDFFDPIFHAVNKDKDAVFNVITTILDGLNFHDLSKVIGKLQTKIGGEFQEGKKNCTTTEKTGLDLGSGNFNGEFGSKWGVISSGSYSRSAIPSTDKTGTKQDKDKGSKDKWGSHTTREFNFGWESGNSKGFRNPKWESGSKWKGGYTVGGDSKSSSTISDNPSGEKGTSYSDSKYYEPISKSEGKGKYNFGGSSKGSKKSTSKSGIGWGGGFTIEGSSKDSKWHSGSKEKGEYNRGQSNTGFGDKGSEEKGSSKKDSKETKWEGGSKSKEFDFDWGSHGGISNSGGKSKSGSAITDTTYWTWKGIR